MFLLCTHSLNSDCHNIHTPGTVTATASKCDCHCIKVFYIHSHAHKTVTAVTYTLITQWLTLHDSVCTNSKYGNCYMLLWYTHCAVTDTSSHSVVHTTWQQLPHVIGMYTLTVQLLTLYHSMLYTLKTQWLLPHVSVMYTLRCCHYITQLYTVNKQSLLHTLAAQWLTLHQWVVYTHFTLTVHIHCTLTVCSLQHDIHSVR